MRPARTISVLISGCAAVGIALLVAADQAIGAETEATPLVLSAIGEWRPQHLLVAAFCLLGALILTFEFILFFRARENVSASDIMRGFSVTLILIGVVALLGIGYDQQQVQPAIALFGTLLGYLLGRGERRDQPKPAAALRPHAGVQPPTD